MSSPGARVMVLTLLVACAGCDELTGGSTTDETALLTSALQTLDEIVDGSDMADGDNAGRLAAPWTGELVPVLAGIRLDSCVPAATRSGATSKHACPQIGNNGDYISGVTFELKGCKLPTGTTVTGSIHTNITRDLAAGSPCAAGAMLTVSEMVTVLITRTTPGGGQTKVTSSATLNFTHVLGQAPARKDVIVSAVTREVEVPGSPLATYKLYGAATVDYDRTAGITRTYTRDLNVTHVEESRTVKATFSSAALPADCCFPTSGSMTLEATKGATFKDTFTFESPCGRARLGADPVTFSACE